MRAAVRASALLAFLFLAFETKTHAALFFFTADGRLLVTPGCYEFDPRGL